MWYGVIVWALMALLAGTYPLRQWDGQQWPVGSDAARMAGGYLAGGLFCSIFVIKGDMEWLSVGLGLEGASWVSMCPWCLANNHHGRIGMGSVPTDSCEEQLISWGYSKGAL